MRTGFLGIISPRGLESLVPETEHAALFLTRRAYRNRTAKAVCFWAVMDDSKIAEVRGHLYAQNRAEAFRVLRMAAHDFGTILPHSEEDVAEAV